MDEVMGTLHFAEQFEKRYGSAHPEFFAGTFEDALKESCLKPAKEVCFRSYAAKILFLLQISKTEVYFLCYAEKIISCVFASR